jgi:DNA-binding response OmpR family regulator
MNGRAPRNRKEKQQVKKRVLICDDEPYILESVGYVVRSAGYECLTAEDGASALRLAIKKKPDLIILDIMLPQMTGFEVCRELKSRSDTREIHVMILSARGQEIDTAHGMQSGANEYITKPFSPRKLRKRMEEILGRNP